MVAGSRRVPAFLVSATPGGKLFPNTSVAHVVMWLFWGGLVITIAVSGGREGLLLMIPSLLFSAVALVVAGSAGHGTASPAQLRFLCVMLAVTSTAASFHLLDPDIRTWYGAAHVNDAVLTSLAIFVATNRLGALSFLALSVWNVAPGCGTTQSYPMQPPSTTARWYSIESFPSSQIG